MGSGTIWGRLVGSGETPSRCLRLVEHRLQQLDHLGDRAARLLVAPRHGSGPRRLSRRAEEEHGGGEVAKLHCGEVARARTGAGLGQEGLVANYLRRSAGALDLPCAQAGRASIRTGTQEALPFSWTSWHCLRTSQHPSLTRSRHNNLPSVPKSLHTRSNASRMTIRSKLDELAPCKIPGTRCTDMLVWVTAVCFQPCKLARIVPKSLQFQMDLGASAHAARHLQKSPAICNCCKNPSLKNLHSHHLSH